MRVARRQGLLPERPARVWFLVTRRARRRAVGAAGLAQLADRRGGRARGSRRPSTGTGGRGTTTRTCASRPARAPDSLRCRGPGPRRARPRRSPASVLVGAASRTVLMISWLSSTWPRPRTWPSSCMATALVTSPRRAGRRGARFQHARLEHDLAGDVAARRPLSRSSCCRPGLPRRPSAGISAGRRTRSAPGTRRVVAPPGRGRRRLSLGEHEVEVAGGGGLTHGLEQDLPGGLWSSTPWRLNSTGIGRQEL